MKNLQEPAKLGDATARNLDYLSFDLQSLDERTGEWHTTVLDSRTAGSSLVSLGEENPNYSDSRASPQPILLDTQSLDGGSESKNDDICLEASEHARVWYVYNEESNKTDTAIADASNRGIDVLLVFTGLFSAVLTTFVIQSYQLMTPSSLDTTNTLLSQYLSSLTTTAVNESSNMVESSSPSSFSTVAMGSVPTLVELRWVNGLWFAALACSLSAALFSMLAKQWLQATPNVSGSPRHRARQRQRRYNQIQTWHVMTVINALPLLLHVSLLLFFAGLIVLLWSGNLAITVVTCVIVALVFGFYFGSIWLSMVYPECPYQHPISEQLRCWITRREGLAGSDFHPQEDLEMALEKVIMYTSWKERETDHSPAHRISSDDYIDACSLVWLFAKCPNAVATVVGLRAIGGLPRHFTAFHVLRKAGAVALVLREFRACFHRDATLDSQWYVLKADDAEKYCRAWMRLTCGTTLKWPEEFVKPLETLRWQTQVRGLGGAGRGGGGGGGGGGGEGGGGNVSAIADCTRAIVSRDSRDGRLLVLSHLARYTEGRVEFCHEMQCWLLDTFLQCSLLSQVRFRPKDHIAKVAVPVLLRLLHRTKQTLASHVRSAIALSLSYMTGGTMGPALFNDEESRRDRFYELVIPALTAIVDDPGSFGVDDELLDLIAVEFSRLASLALSPTIASTTKSRLTSSGEQLDLKSITQRGLSKLYLDGRVRNIPSDVLSDVLQILYPPVMLTRAEYPLFVRALLQALWSTSDPRVLVGSVLRLLEPLLSMNPDPAVVDTFIEGGGIAVLLRAAQTGDTDSRRLQLDCLRNVCLFIRTTAEYHTLHDDSLSPHDPDPDPYSDSESEPNSKEERLDYIFQSDFFTTLNSTIAARRWWLPEVAEIWVPALLKLCEIRPRELVWDSVEATFRRFAEFNEGKDGCLQLVDELDQMKAMMMGCNK